MNRDMCDSHEEAPGHRAASSDGRRNMSTFEELSHQSAIREVSSSTTQRELQACTQDLGGYHFQRFRLSSSLVLGRSQIFHLAGFSSPRYS